MIASLGQTFADPPRQFVPARARIFVASAEETMQNTRMPRSRVEQVLAVLLAVWSLSACAGPAAADCPEGCECRSPEVYCSRATLTDFPEDLENDTTFLDVGHNNITAIEDDAFVSLGLPLLAVLVADNNSISSVSVNAFRGLEYLRFLHLSGNRLTSLHKDVFAHNPSILHVDLTGNALLLPSDGPFLSSPSLEWLDLDYCHLSKLSTSVFADVPKLRYLNLANNSLKELNVIVLNKLTYLRYFKMSGNPLACTCSLKPLWKWLQQQNIKADAICDSPAKHSGDSWSVVKELYCNK